MRNGSLCLKLPNIQVFCGTSKMYPRHFIFCQYITTTSVQVLHTLPIKSKMMKKNIIAISPPYFTVKIYKIPSMTKKVIINFRALNRFFFLKSHSEILCDKMCFSSPKLDAKSPTMPVKLKLLQFISIGLIEL